MCIHMVAGEDRSQVPLRSLRVQVASKYSVPSQGQSRTSYRFSANHLQRGEQDPLEGRDSNLYNPPSLSYLLPSMK